MIDNDPMAKAVVSAYNKRVYDRIGSDISVTDMLNPVRYVVLNERHGNKSEITSVKDIFASTLGLGYHSEIQRYLKNHPDWLVERKLNGVFNGVRITGRFDALYKKRDLYDIKLTRCYKYIKGDYTDWATQLNLYGWLLSQDGINVKSLKIFMVLYDWNYQQTFKQQKYPASNILIYGPLPMWTQQQTTDFMTTWINSWISATKLDDKDLPLCSKQERWATMGGYKLYRKPTFKRATKMFDTKQRAESYLKACKDNDADKWKDAVITEDMSNNWKRCDYCRMAPFCNQYKNKIER